MADVLDSPGSAGWSPSITAEPRGNRLAHHRVSDGHAQRHRARQRRHRRICRHHAPRIRRPRRRASAAGFSIDQYVRVAGAGECPGVRASNSRLCPNVHGAPSSADPRALADLVRGGALPRTPLWVKLPPIAVGSPSIADVARAAIDPALGVAGSGTTGGPDGRPGADALCLCNTTPAMAIDPSTRLPRLANVTGGLSGPAVHPVVVRLVHIVHTTIARQAGTPIVAIGGVAMEDAAEFILAGPARARSARHHGRPMGPDPHSPRPGAMGPRPEGLGHPRPCRRCQTLIRATGAMPAAGTDSARLIRANTHFPLLLSYRGTAGSTAARGHPRRRSSVRPRILP